MLHNQIHTACLQYVHVACSCQCCIPCQCFMSMSMSIDIYIEMPECQTVRHPVSLVPDWKKLTMLKPVRYRTKLTQSGIFVVQYRTKIWDAGVPMPALVSSMPMPSYDENVVVNETNLHRLQKTFKNQVRTTYGFHHSTIQISKSKS
jgi:hypothetical protein